MKDEIAASLAYLRPHYEVAAEAYEIVALNEGVVPVEAGADAGQKKAPP